MEALQGCVCVCVFFFCFFLKIKFQKLNLRLGHSQKCQHLACLLHKHERLRGYKPPTKMVSKTSCPQANHRQYLKCRQLLALALTLFKSTNIKYIQFNLNLFTPLVWASISGGKFLFYLVICIFYTVELMRRARIVILPPEKNILPAGALEIVRKYNASS